MSRKKISTTIYVTPEQSEKLKLLHERTKVPVAVYIREGIDVVLRQYSNLLPGQGQLALDPLPHGGRGEPRERAGAYGRGSATEATRQGTVRGATPDLGDSDDIDGEIDGDPSPPPANVSAGGHAAHAAAKK